MLSQKRFREIAWEIGKRYPISLTADYIALAMVNPHLGQVHWHVGKESVRVARERFAQAPLVIRVYDVTDILFDGSNAHGFFDIEMGNLAGHYYFGVPRLARNYLVEFGLRSGDGRFHPLARSNTAFFERDRPAGNYQTGGLFVGGALQRTFPVENIFDAPVYEKMNRALLGIKRPKALSVALVLAGINQATGLNSPWGSFIQNFAQELSKFGCHARVFAPQSDETGPLENKSLLNKIAALSEVLQQDLTAAHEEKPLSLIHCHDWYSAAAGFSAAKKLNLPMILSLHSTEYERAHGYETDHLSEAICRWERKGVQEACLVIAPHSSTRQQVINLYGASPDKVVIIPDIPMERTGGVSISASEIKRGFGLNPDAPLVLFAGEISHAAGADLMMEAVFHVCPKHGAVQFLLAGDGPLKGELEARTWHGGIGHRCRFLGDVSSETFEAVLAAADFVAIPARTWQDEGLAQMAIEYGKPVLTTHQAGINCIVHGQNGLITYDNPGSVIWGIQELLANPLQGSMLRLVAKRKANQGISLDNVVAQHYMYYEITLKNSSESAHG